MRFRLFYINLFLIFPLTILSQVTINEKDFIRYTLKEGLSDNYISGIEQDANGYIWIATRGGLNRFDGKIFKQFFSNDKYNAIPDNSIYSMRKLSNDDFALATNDGVQILSTRTLKQVNLHIADDEKLRYWSNYCMYAMNDADGNYGVSTKTGFYIFSSTGQLKKRYDHFTRQNIGEWMIFGEEVYMLPDGNIGQTNQNGILLYDRRSQQFSDASVKYPGLNAVKKKSNSLFFFVSKSEFVHINLETNSFDLVDVSKGKQASYIPCIELTPHINWFSNGYQINDTTWAINCYTKGFFLITLNLVTRKFSCSEKRYFADNICNEIFSDRDGNLWVATNEGLFKQNSRPKLIETFELTDAVAKKSIITAVYPFGNRIFAGTNNKEILILDKYSRKLIHRTQFPLISNLSNSVRTLYMLHPDTLWIGTSAGFYWLHLRNYTSGEIDLDGDGSNVFIYLLYADKKRNVWVSTNIMNSINYYDKKKGSFVEIDTVSNPDFKTNITSVAEDKAGNIWIAGDAVVRWNPGTQKIDTIIERLQTQQNYKKGYYVMADSKGDIWTEVNDDGLAKLTGNPMHLRPENLTPEKNSILSPALFNDKIFVLTAKGVGYFDIKTLKSTLFTENDGMPRGLVSSFYFVEDPGDSSVWFAISNYLCRIPKLNSYKSIKPPVLNITALSVLNDTIFNYPYSKISLNHKQGDINIFFSAINYNDPGNMQFSYRIKNKKDTSWINAGDQQNILLTNISPGNYKIELRVSAFDNKWPDQIKEMEIEIKPPFWRTPLFFISIGLALSVLAFYLYRFRIRQIKQRANIDRLLTKTEMKALHAQMNPHFIFNCLNSIREMILNNENNQASLYLSKFARLIRITLNHSSRQFVSLADTIDYLERYIEMEKIRNTRFSYKMEVAGDLNTNDILVPPMLIQPFIENAIWHGDTQNQNLNIRISFTQEKNQLICIVEDNGIGINESLKSKNEIQDEPSLGIENIKQRIELINEKYNLQSSLVILDKSTLSPTNGSGTIVKLQLPLSINENLWI